MVRHRMAVLMLLSIASGACATGGPPAGPRVVQPGAPGEPGRVVAPAPPAAPKYADGDVKFMQGMIGHHAQALEMTALLPARTATDAMKLLAKRIEVSQTDEIRMMQRWLESRGLEAPTVHAHHVPGATLMPGMLTSGEMSQLAEARGVAFDRMFLELMIKHHEGALVMVKELFASPGAGQESEIFAFASDVDSDQRMEIDRMSAMLAKSKEFEQ